MQILLFEKFDNAALPPNTSWPGSFTFGKDNWVIVENSTNGAYGGSGKSLKATYPAISGDQAAYPWSGFDLSPYNTDHVYIRFRAKMPGAKHGLKFVKVFGQRDAPVGYANTTFGLDYTGVDLGGMYCVSYGDGSTTENDTASILGFDGLGYPGRAQGLPGFSVTRPQGKIFGSADWGTGWHLFELYVKFNSGTTSANEKNDGAIFVRIDGKTYLDAKGIFNRHPLNGKLDRIEILGWTQTPRGAAVPSFEIWYDNIEISLNGWGNSPI